MNELRIVIAVVENDFCGVVVVDNAVVLQCNEYPPDKRNSHTSWVSSKQCTVDLVSTGERIFGVVLRKPVATSLQPPA